MKDSGIKWLGEIPSHWKTHPLYCYFDERKNKNVLGRETNLLSLSYGNVIRKDINTNGGLLPENFNGYNIIEKDDIVLRLTDLQNDKKSLRTGLCKERGIITSAYVTIKPKKNVSSHYFRYLLHSYDLMKVLYNMGNGVRQGLNFDELKKMMLIEPPLDEQKKIANFLDEKCAGIDRLIADLNEEISTLEEYKRSTITEAVCKGLNPNAEMKDSGIEWIGKIPTNFTMIKTKYLCNVRNGLTYSPTDVCGDNEGVLVLRSSNIKDGKLAFDDNVFVNCEIKSELKVKKGDILICSRNGSRNLIGKNAIIEEDLNASFGAFMMIARGIDNPKYMYYILNSNVFSYYLGTFLTATINQLTGFNFSNMIIPYCYDREIQEEIVEFLNEKCKSIDAVISEKQEQISTLEQYKKSVIYEYTTGKKEVV